MQFLLAVIAVSPWLLRLIASYLSEFNFGPSGVSGKTKQTVANKAEIENEEMVTRHNNELANSKDKAETGNEPLEMAVNDAPQPKDVQYSFRELLPQSKKMLRTLWKYQVEHFGPDDIRRWGFTVGTTARDYTYFSLGTLVLLQKGWVSVDARGFVFLTNEGIAFCKQENGVVSAYPEYYSQFAN